MTFTKEAILTRLIAAYAGPGNTEEGSFAGDVLRACADAMAELWSTEINGLERRAFVSTAVGDDLTAVCADRGVERQEGEDDESLRRRALTKLRSSPASGNADHYKEWCGQIPDILRVRILPLTRGNGTVDIIAVAQDGKSPSQETLQETQAVIDTQRPVGADAQVFAATETAMDISATVTLMDGASLGGVQAAFAAAMSQFCRDCALLTQTISYAKALRLLLDCEGVADVADFTLCGSDESVMLDERSIPVCGTLSLQEVSV